MPRPGPRRVHLTTRVHPDARTRYQTKAAGAGVDLAVMLRRMLTYAEENMPDTWDREDLEQR